MRKGGGARGFEFFADSGWAKGFFGGYFFFASEGGEENLRNFVMKPQKNAFFSVF
jgi:hypothetical protein